MQALGADVADELANVGDVIVEVEGALVARDHARVDPVRDVDLVLRQEALHRVAQQGRVVTRERRDHEHRRVLLEPADHLGLVAVALEALQATERLRDHRLFRPPAPRAAHVRRMDPELRLLVVLADAVKKLVARREAGSAG